MQKALFARQAPASAKAAAGRDAMMKSPSAEPVVMVVSAADPVAAERQIDTFLAGLSVPIDRVGQRSAARQLETPAEQANRLREAMKNRAPERLRALLRRWALP